MNNIMFQCSCGREYSFESDDDNTRNQKLSVMQSLVDDSCTLENIKDNKKFFHLHDVFRSIEQEINIHQNVLTIRGKSQTGKTHLLQLIANELSHDYRVFYFTASQFGREIVRFLQSGKIIDFEFELLEADILMIDDIHTLKGKEYSLDLLTGIVNDICLRKKVIFSECITEANQSHIEDSYSRLINKFKVIELPS